MWFLFTEITTDLHYKDQTVLRMLQNSRCFCENSYQTHKPLHVQKYTTSFIWRVRKVAKGIYWLRHVCPAPTGWIVVKFGTGDLLKSVQKIQIWFKSDPNIGHST
jgi:hypothetical protein